MRELASQTVPEGQFGDHSTQSAPPLTELPSLMTLSPPYDAPLSVRPQSTIASSSPIPESPLPAGSSASLSITSDPDLIEPSNQALGGSTAKDGDGLSSRMSEVRVMAPTPPAERAAEIAAENFPPLPLTSLPARGPAAATAPMGWAAIAARNTNAGQTIQVKKKQEPKKSLSWAAPEGAWDK